MDQKKMDGTGYQLNVCDSREVLNECISASRALAELKGILRTASMPGAFGTYLKLLESKSSAEMDGVHAELLDVLRAYSTTERGFGEDVDNIVKESEMTSSFLKKEVTVKNLIKICSTISGRDMALEDDAKGQVEDLVGYVSSTDGITDGLVKACTAMFAYEDADPFPDYCGRTGRVMFQMLLNRYGLTDGYCLPISSSIMKHHVEYDAAIQRSTDSRDNQEYILLMLRLIRECAFDTMQTVFSITTAYQDAVNRCCEETLCPVEVVSIVFNNVYSKSANIVNAGIAERVTAMKYLKALEACGILEKEKIGRESLFRNKSLCEILVK